MSTTTSVFVGPGPSIEACRELVEQTLQIDLTRSTESEWNLYKAEYEGIYVALFDQHGLEDDCGIEFTKFPLQLALTRYAMSPTEFDESKLRSLAVSLAETLYTHLGAYCIVVEELQVLVQSFGSAD